MWFPKRWSYLSTSIWVNKQTNTIGRNPFGFDPALLEKNHKTNQERCRLAMLEKTTTIIIDNTNIMLWEMRPYHLLAQEHGYETTILEIPPPPLEELLRRLESRTDKRVPRETLERMLERWKPGVTP